jgi:hypothetical protein
MPRTPKQEVITIQGPSGLVASAARLTGGRKPRKPRKAEPWYRQLWTFYDTIGEFRYAASWVGNTLSRAVLEVWEDGKPTENEEAIAAMASFFGGKDGQREMLRQVGTHLTVPGDCYLVGEDMGNAPDKWSVVSATRISVVGQTPTQPGTWKVGKHELDDPIVIRLWRPHPDDQERADSPSRAVLPILAEIDGMTKYVAAQITSRLSGAGIFTVPSEMTFASIIGNATANGDETDATNINTGIQAFLMELMELMMEATEDPSSPAARTPFLLQGPGEHLDKLKHITFWSELDAVAKELRDEAIRRLALGMDMPPEILTGSGDLNHWNAWQVEEASIKAHTEPLLHIITQGITEKYLWPYLVDALEGEDEDSVRRFTIVADTTKIRLRPNRSKEALELYDRGVLSLAAAARENGFDEGDLMTEDERKEFFLRKTASGSTTPELVAWALSQLGIQVPPGMLAAEETPTEAPPAPSLLEHPDRPIPDPIDAEAAALNVVVFRALERVGAKLRTKYPDTLVRGSAKVSNEKLYRFANIPADIVDDLLAGAWDCMEGLATSPTAVDSYVRELLATNRSHQRESLALRMRGRK